MENLFSLRSHPTEALLEEYAFRRLPEKKTAAVEEHLLVCQSCQEALAGIDEFVLLMKAGTAAVAPSAFGERIKRVWSTIWVPLFQPRMAWAAGGALAALLLVLYVNVNPQPEVTAELKEYRGGENPSSDLYTAIAPARKPLVLQIVDTGLPASSYRIDVVDVSGKQVWQGTAKRLNSKLQSSIAKGLPKGSYRVEVFSPAELLKQFGLRTE